MTVMATREGLVGRLTASGWRITPHMPFVALPSSAALYSFVRVRNPKNGRTALAIVLDVGPHSDRDDDYVLRGARPAAERGISIVNGVKSVARNKAGIDLGENVWAALGMQDNGDVEWEFLNG